MTEESKMSQDVGCVLGLIGLVVAVCLLSAVATLSGYYMAIVDIGGVVIGVVLGAMAGAGIGAILPHVSKFYRTKAGIGPLTPLACFWDAARLRARHLGITEDKNEKRRARPAVAFTLL